MELWIRSQDRTKLMNTDSLVISKDKDTFYICDSLEGNIAEYKTKERALEVLDEIQNIFSLENKNYEEADLFLKAKMLDIVYEMPEE